MRWEEYKNIEFELHEGGIRVCRLNRPERLNAINPALSREIHSLFRDLQDDDEVNVAIITNGDGFRVAVERQFRTVDVQPEDYHPNCFLNALIDYSVEPHPGAGIEPNAEPQLATADSQPPGWW